MRKNNKHFRKYLSYSLLLVMIGIFLIPKTAYLSGINKDNIIDLSNQERIDNGLEILMKNKALSRAAYDKGKAIFEKQTFKHEIEGKKFSYWIKEAGYGYSFIGENLAIDFITAEGVVKAWMGSPTHKENILNSSFSEIGVAVLNGNFHGENSILVVQIFGSPATAPLASMEPEKNIPASGRPGNPVAYLNAGLEESLFHSQGLRSGKNSTESYLSPSPFEFTANNIIFDITEFPEKWVFLPIALATLIFLIFHINSQRFSHEGIEIAAKKTKGSKPAPV